MERRQQSMQAENTHVHADEFQYWCMIEFGKFGNPRAVAGQRFRDLGSLRRRQAGGCAANAHN
eukprot:2003227-Prorocentrum_lima.AAC.1